MLEQSVESWVWEVLYTMGLGLMEGAKAHVRGGHAVTVFWLWDIVYVVISMACRMFVKPR